jgi:hypothetical protein
MTGKMQMHMVTFDPIIIHFLTKVMRVNNRTKQTGTEKREIRHYNSSRNKIIQIHTHHRS